MSNTLAKVHGFHAQLSVEEKWLRQVPSLLPGCSLKDVSKAKKFQPLGVDCLAYGTRELPTGIEFKFDTYSSGNFALEWVSQDRPSSDRAPAWTNGWMATCQAGWLIYAFVNSGDLFILDMTALRAWLSKNYAQFPSTSVANKRYFSYCSLVPIETLCQQLPKSAWHWLNMRTSLPSEVFESESLVSLAIRTQATSATELPHLFDTGSRRSEPLTLAENDCRPLHRHLWAANRLKTRHLQVDKKRDFILKPLPLCIRSEMTRQAA